jgi:hypothetical protein
MFKWLILKRLKRLQAAVDGLANRVVEGNNASGDMSPVPARNDEPDHATANVKLPHNFSRRDFSGMHGADGPDVSLGNLASRAGLAPCISALADHVSHVVGISTEEKVLWVDADGIIAAMKDMGIVWDRPDEQLIGVAVGQNLSPASHVEGTVASTAFPAEPVDAAGRFLGTHVAPKFLLRGRCFSTTGPGGAFTGTEPAFPSLYPMRLRQGRGDYCTAVFTVARTVCRMGIRHDGLHIGHCRSGRFSS